MSSYIGSLPPEQQAIQDRCFHPTGTFIDFKKEEIEQSISDRFEQQVRLFPDRLAIKSKDYELSYRELNQAANRVAGAVLARLGDGEEPVALLLGQGGSLITGMLGVLKAGRFALPLDPSYPSDRTIYMLEDSQARLILTNKKNLSLARELAKSGIQPLNIDDLDAGLPIGDPGLSINPDAITYILYTSGSTGQPKGLLQNHRNVLHQIMLYTNILHICAEDRLTLLTSVTGQAMSNIFSALLNGAALYSMDVREEGVTDLAGLLIQQEITMYISGSPLYRRFIDTLTGMEEFPQLRVLKISSQAVFKSDVELYKKHFSPDCVFTTGLASSETGMVRNYYIDNDTEITTSTLPVGFAVDGKEVRLVDDDGNEVGFNQVGEIEVRSRYLRPGYWGKPELTQENFRSGPAGGNQRIYRMGDMGRMSPNGCLELVGRKDFQVKIRGFRVEVAEVEMALLALSSIKEAVVLAIEDTAGEPRLAAYLVPATEPAPAIGEVRNFLRETLPDHMVPPHYVFLNALPLLPNGKLDRRALPAPDQGRPQLETAFVSPRAPIEAVLAGIWADVLEIDRVGIHDDFLDLGGDSLRAAAMFAQIEETLGKKLPLAIMVEASTVAQLARILVYEGRSAPQSLIAIQPRGKKPPFFCVHGAGGHVLGFQVLARHLGEDQPFYGLEAPGRDGEQRPIERVEALAARYLDEIRVLQPEGPYYLGGFSMGGTVAFEMAQQLRSRGEDVGLVALLDSTTPRNTGENGLHPLRRFGGLFQYFTYHSNNLLHLGLRDKMRYVTEKARGKAGRVRRRRISPYSRIAQTNTRAKSRYIPKPYAGPITLFWAKERPPSSTDRRLAWRDFTTAGLDLHVVPGDHASMMVKPHVQVLAQELKACLDAAQTVKASGMK